MRQMWLPDRGMAAQAEGVVEKAAAAAASALRQQGSQLTGAVGLYAGSLMQQYGGALYLLGGAMAVYFLWRGTFRLAGMFVDLTETVAEVGFLGFAATVVVLVGLYFRQYFVINPSAVYRLALSQLKASKAVTEVVGSPLVGGDVHVTVQSGGGLKLKLPMRLKQKSPRVQMLFLVSGPLRQGVVSVEAKKKQGKHIFKLLAVDVQPAAPAAAATGAATWWRRVASSGSNRGGADAAGPRIYVQGDDAAYGRGGLLWELRQPYLAATSMQHLNEVEDEMDDERDRLALPRSAPEEEEKKAETGSSQRQQQQQQQGEGTGAGKQQGLVGSREGVGGKRQGRTGQVAGAAKDGAKGGSWWSGVWGGSGNASQAAPPP